MDQYPQSGRRIPLTTFAHLQDGELRSIGSRDVFDGGRSLAIGVPGAYTPVCTQKHVPNLVANADKLKRSGFLRLVCIAPNDPFVLDHWARELSPKGEVEFYSDGNLDFCRALGVASRIEDLFLGERCERFLMIVRDGRIEHFRVEPEVTSFTCTRAEDALAAPANPDGSGAAGPDYHDV